MDETKAVRPPTVAGTFYPADPTELEQTVRGYLANASAPQIKGEIFGIIAPHAGYVYSGQTAAYSYKQLIEKKYDVAVILAPNHIEDFSEISIFQGLAYSTPLGKVAIDTAFAQLLSENSTPSAPIILSMHGHAWENMKRTEHSIEVQLPFLQIVQPELPIVPIVLGSQDHSTINTLVTAIKSASEKSGKRVLIIASSDLSHYHKLSDAKYLDGLLIKEFSDFDYFGLDCKIAMQQIEACGYGAITGAMQVCEVFGATNCKLLHLATSADSEFSQDTNHVVGYFSGAICKDNSSHGQKFPEFTPEEKKYLCGLAKAATEMTVAALSPDFEIRHDEKFHQVFPAFVTINKNGNLRGCVGHIVSSADINSEVIETARMASTMDSRFGAIRPEELPELTYEVTILSQMQRIFDFSKIQIGKHGLYIRTKYNNGLLLPQVATEYNWNTEEFLKNACRKAGLPEKEFLKSTTEVYIFEAVIANEK